MNAKQSDHLGNLKTKNFSQLEFSALILHTSKDEGQEFLLHAFPQGTKPNKFSKLKGVLLACSSVSRVVLGEEPGVFAFQFAPDPKQKGAMKKEAAIISKHRGSNTAESSFMMSGVTSYYSQREADHKILVQIGDHVFSQALLSDACLLGIKSFPPRPQLHSNDFLPCSQVLDKIRDTFHDRARGLQLVVLTLICLVPRVSLAAINKVKVLPVIDPGNVKDTERCFKAGFSQIKREKIEIVVILPFLYPDNIVTGRYRHWRSSTEFGFPFMMAGKIYNIWLLEVRLSIWPPMAIAPGHASQAFLKLHPTRLRSISVHRLLSYISIFIFYRWCIR